MAIINLVLQDILKKENNNFIINKIDYEITPLKIKTLAEKIAENIQTYISEKFNTGEKIPSNAKLAEIFNVSIKTIHDSLKILAKGGYIHTRRGKYGTIVLSNNDLYTELYEYEKIEQKIRQEISLKYKIGDKLPSIKTFSKYYNTSEKTIKKALDNLAGDGYITFSRGRYGGTFILDIPQTSGEAYKWLAINTDFITN